MRTAAQHREHRDHCGPEHAEFVAPFRQCPYIADLKMSAQQHRYQQIHRSEQGNGAREESQCESDGGNELDRSGECNLCGGHGNPQARKIERVDLELIGPAEDVTPEMRHEHQADIDSDECQCRGIERYFWRIRRCCDRCGPQDKLDEHKSAQKPTQYVKICTLYGDGFYYIPGTDICLKIGGYVRAEYAYNYGPSMTNGPFANVAGYRLMALNDRL